jgi:DnaA regulatory inactivator Hda
MTATGMKQIPLELTLPALPAFAGFLPGDNAAVVSELRAQAWPGAPVYLWGPAGSGKTQLLRELAARASEEGVEAQWFDATTPLPWALGEHTGLVLLDGAEQWDDARQHAAFTLFVEAATRIASTSHLRLGVQFASAGRVPPVDLAVREDLRTRLGWGVVHALKPLSEDETRAALRQEAARRGIGLGEDVVDYLLTRFARDLKSLMRLLHRLDGFAMAEKRAVTVPLLRRMLAEEAADAASSGAGSATAPARATRRLTLFDLDGTLIEQDSDHAFGEFMVALGWADGAAWAARNDEFYAQYQAGRLDLDEYVDFATSVWRSRPAEELAAVQSRFMDEVIGPRLHPSARALVREHQAAGDLVAIVTATNEFVTRPIADAFGVPELLAVELDRDADGRVTGGIRGVPTFQAGKVTRVAEWLAGQGAAWSDFESVTVYSDSPNDLPLLEQATDPVATNPSPTLEAVARARGWRILRLFE